MPTVKLKATKMSDAKVSFISLVERGANRIPFKIVKQEKGMSKSAFAGLDLTNLFARKSEKAPQAQKVEVVGVVTMKGDGLESVKAQLEAHGVKVSEVVEMEDGSVVFKQGNGEVTGEGEVVRISETIALITKGLPAHLTEAEGEVFKSQGYFPGVGTALETLCSNVMETVEKEEDPAKVASQIAQMFDDAKEYVVKMAQAMPSIAFKAESIEAVAPVVEEPKAEEPAADPVVKAEEPAQVAEDVKKSEEVVDVEDKTNQMGLTEDKVSAIVQAQVGSAMETLTKKMEEMLSGLTGQVTKSLQEVEGKVSQVEAVAKSASDKVSSIVVGGGNTDDHDAVTKSERVGFGGREIDTAFMPRSVRKAASR